LFDFLEKVLAQVLLILTVIKLAVNKLFIESISDLTKCNLQKT
jgi:hypothetical protein